jgi:hypothetical protein
MTSPQPAFGDYQLEIYLDGLQGVLPSFPMAFAELEARAERALPPSVLSYVAVRFGGTQGSSSCTRPPTGDLAASLVSRAEAAGFRGIVVTLDTWVTGWRPRDLAASNFPQLRGHCLAGAEDTRTHAQRYHDALQEAMRQLGKCIVTCIILCGTRTVGTA